MVDHGTEAPARRTAPGRVLASASRVSLLHVLQEDGPSPTAALAARTGLHENTVREHLQRLVAARLVVRETERRTTRGRPRTIYRATPGDARTGPGAARHLSESAARARLTRVLLRGFGVAATDVAQSARTAGRVMSRELPLPAGPADDQLRALEAHLEEVGFEPVPDLERGVVDLYRCPFLELARERPEVVCSVHLGLARGVLEQVGGPVTAERLVPFVGPRHCELHLTGLPASGAAPAPPAPPSPRVTRRATTEGAP